MWLHSMHGACHRWGGTRCARRMCRCAGSQLWRAERLLYHCHRVVDAAAAAPQRCMGSVAFALLLVCVRYGSVVYVHARTTRVRAMNVRTGRAGMCDVACMGPPVSWQTRSTHSTIHAAVELFMTLCGLPGFCCASAWDLRTCDACGPYDANCQLKAMHGARGAQQTH